MNFFSKPNKSDKATADPASRRLSNELQKLVARGNYEPPKVISYPTKSMTKLKPVTMMSNL